MGRNKRDYEIFIQDNALFKIRQLLLYHVEDTTKWIMKKRGGIDNSIKSLIKAKKNTEYPKPKTFIYNIYGYHIGQPYKTDDDGRILGKWAQIGTMAVKTDEIRIVTENELQEYSLFRIPIPFI